MAELPADDYCAASGEGLRGESLVSASLKLAVLIEILPMEAGMTGICQQHVALVG